MNFLILNDTLITDTAIIQRTFHDFYSDLLCCELENRKQIQLHVIREGCVLNQEQRDLLNLSFSAQEIKEALWSIPDDKAPGLDGFNSAFYKASWSVVGEDMVQAIQELFQTGKLLKAWNISAVTLIPKVACPSHPGDFLPISCFHVLYKCISKLICSRLYLVLGSLINPAQEAFVAGRSIVHNVLLCQDVVKHYSRKHCLSSVLLKIDLRKAYDTMD